jgi:hypothetical protein
MLGSGFFHMPAKPSRGGALPDVLHYHVPAVFGICTAMVGSLLILSGWRRVNSMDCSLLRT